MTRVSTELPRSPTSAGAARRLVLAHTETLGSRQREDLALMVSELVSNALMHGVGTITLRIDTEAEGVRVEVADEGNVRVAPNPTPGAHGGWGLRIIEELADEWGVLEGSTRVWFRVRGPDPEA